MHWKRNYGIWSGQIVVSDQFLHNRIGLHKSVSKMVILATNLGIALPIVAKCLKESKNSLFAHNIAFDLHNCLLFLTNCCTAGGLCVKFWLVISQSDPFSVMDAPTPPRIIIALLDRFLYSDANRRVFKTLRTGTGHQIHNYILHQVDDRSPLEPFDSDVGVKCLRSVEGKKGLRPKENLPSMMGNVTDLGVDNFQCRGQNELK